MLKCYKRTNLKVEISVKPVFKRCHVTYHFYNFFQLFRDIYKQFTNY